MYMTLIIDLICGIESAVCIQFVKVELANPKIPVTYWQCGPYSTVPTLGSLARTTPMVAIPLRSYEDVRVDDLGLIGG